MFPESKELTASSTCFELVKLEVMPFALHNAPVIFQRLMIIYVLQGCAEFAGAYLDDLVIYSRSWYEHLDHLHEGFRRLLEAGLTLQVPQCPITQKEVH